MMLIAMMPFPMYCSLIKQYHSYIDSLMFRDGWMDGGDGGAPMFAVE